MSDVAERHRKVAATFTERVRAVPDDAWDNPAPCEGWVARDVVRHLTEWVTGFLANVGIELEPGPSVDDDPVGAWEAFDRQIQALLDDPQASRREVDTPMGRGAVGDTLGQIYVGDVVIHTWDLARAAGLDERLDAGEVRDMLAGMEPLDDVLRASGHFGPRIEVSDDADEQTRLIAFTGRTP